MKVYFPNTDWTNYAIDLSQEYFKSQEERELGAFIGYYQATLPLIGYLPARFWVIPRIAYESLSARDLPARLRPPSYECKDNESKLVWLYFVFYGGVLFMGIATIGYILYLQKTGVRL